MSSLYDQEIIRSLREMPPETGGWQPPVQAIERLQRTLEVFIWKWMIMIMLRFVKDS